VRRIDDHFRGRAPGLRAILDLLLRALERTGPLRVDAVASSINLVSRHHFAGVAVRRDHLRIGFLLNRQVSDCRIARVERVGVRRFSHHVRVCSRDEVDAQLLEWLAEAQAMQASARSSRGVMRAIAVLMVTGTLELVACAGAVDSESTAAAESEDRAGPIASRPTDARSAAGDYISWREHIVDDPAIGGVPIAGGDGLAMADLDRDGHADIVSVHESDTEYDGVADGYVRLAFGSGSPDTWDLATLGEGAEVGAAEDVAIGDLNRDGYPDVIVACELAHLVYFQNPGPSARDPRRWARLIPPVASGRGSFIRVFLADFNRDGALEVVAANKGAQNPGPDDRDPKPISIFEIAGDPLDRSAWKEHVLTRVAVPINAQPIDLDGDGDLDVLGGSRNERRIMWFENRSAQALSFAEHPIEITGTSIPDDERPAAARGTGRALVTGFNLDFADLNGDGRVDVVLAEGAFRLVWLEQPAQPSMPWRLHAIGSIRPDNLVGFALADIDGDGDRDALVGAYSRGPRDADGAATMTGQLGRLAWFENRGDAAQPWVRHDISRRKRGMFDKFLAVDLDGDGDVDFAGTRGNSVPFDGVFWLEQVRTSRPAAAFTRARTSDSEEMPLPPGG
jgi:hypothetical protein